MQLIISARDQVLARYGNQLAALGEGRARSAMARALDHEGDKGPDAGQASARQADGDQVVTGAAVPLGNFLADQRHSLAI